MKLKAGIVSVQLIFLYLIVDNSIANSLYSENDQVIELNVNNFIQNVYNQKKITLVNFYVNWCPHCIQFSHVWKQFAENLRNWKSVVRIAAIDCALDINQELCQTFKISRFPRIRLFGLYAATDDSGTHFEVKQSAEMITELIDYILKIHQMFDLKIFPISVASKNELLNTLPIDLQKQNLIFLEKYLTHLAVEVILDFSWATKHLNFIRVVDRTGSLSNELFVHSLRLPSLIRINKNQSFELIASANSDDEELLRKEFDFHIRLLMPKEVIAFAESKSTEVERVNNSMSVIPRKPVAISLADLYNTLRYGLHKEVIRYKILNSTQVKVLDNFFSIVHKYLPFDNENVHRFFKRMKVWFSNKTSEIKSENLKAALTISDGYLPPLVQWKHCAGSRPHFRGYPCGLWLLFHILSVEEYLENPLKNCHQVLPLMREFIINFFSCDECAKHFESISRNLNSHLVRPESSVLWIWRIHNQVNSRTKGSPSEDPFFPKVQYPTQEMCGQCYQSNSEFNETKVFKFILETYDRKKFTKSAEYFTDQRILNKNIAQSLIENNYIFFLILLNIILAQIQ